MYGSVLDKSFNENKETIILGDFNLDIYKSSHNINNCMHIMDSMNFTQLVKHPPRITSNTTTYIK